MISKKDMDSFADGHRLLLRTKDFVCLLPHPSLQEYISSYNITFPTKDLMPDGFTEIPSGCATLAVEIDTQNLLVNLDGPTTKPYMVGNRTNQLAVLVTVEFKPAGLYALTGIHQRELTDQTICFEAVNSKLSKRISETVEAAENVGELAASLDKLLWESMYAAYHPQLILTLQSIVDRGGNVDIKRLSADSHYSERQLNRIFQQHVGLSAKSFSRLIRIHNSFHLLNKPGTNLTLISDVMGYYDLSHFLRDFKLVCGIAPQEYLRNMSDFYINPLKF